MLQGVNGSKSHQPLNVFRPLNISRIHPHLTGGHNIQHEIRFLCSKCLWESLGNAAFISFLFQAFFTDEYTQHPGDRDKLIRLKDLIAWQVLNMLQHPAERGATDIYLCEFYATCLLAP